MDTNFDYNTAINHNHPFCSSMGVVIMKPGACVFAQPLASLGCGWTKKR